MTDNSIVLLARGSGVYCNKHILLPEASLILLCLRNPHTNVAAPAALLAVAPPSGCGGSPPLTATGPHLRPGAALLVTVIDPLAVPILHRDMGYLLERFCVVI